jgi:hypothetical protein
MDIYNEASEGVKFDDKARAREFVLIDPQADLEIDTSSVLGAGGFGRTMRALFKRGGGSTGAYEHETVAVKMMFCSTKLSEELLKSFHLEAFTLSQYEHRNIVHLFGACIRPPHLCLVQELAEMGRCAALRAPGGAAHARPVARQRGAAADRRALAQQARPGEPGERAGALQRVSSPRHGVAAAAGGLYPAAIAPLARKAQT